MLQLRSAATDQIAKVKGVKCNGPDSLKRYLDCAREGHAALWVHVPNDAKRAVRLLADHRVLHLRHYGQNRQEDLHLH